MLECVPTYDTIQIGLALKVVLQLKHLIFIEFNVYLIVDSVIK